MDKSAGYLSLADWRRQHTVTGDMANTLVLKPTGCRVIKKHGRLGFISAGDFGKVLLLLLRIRHDDTALYGMGKTESITAVSQTPTKQPTKQLDVIAKDAHIAYFNGKDGYFVRFDRRTAVTPCMCRRTRCRRALKGA